MNNLVTIITLTFQSIETVDIGLIFETSIVINLDQTSKEKESMELKRGLEISKKRMLEEKTS
jgi:hypothetical protein